MYKVLRQIKVQRGQGNKRRVVQLKPGDMVPEADFWTNSVLRAHISLGHIEKCGEDVDPEAKPGEAKSVDNLKPKAAKKKGSKKSGKKGGAKAAKESKEQDTGTEPKPAA